MESWCLWGIRDRVAKLQEATALSTSRTDQEILGIKDFKLDFLFAYTRGIHDEPHRWRGIKLKNKYMGNITTKESPNTHFKGTEKKRKGKSKKVSAHF